MPFQKGNQLWRKKFEERIGARSIAKLRANGHDHSRCPACNPQIVPASAQDHNGLYVAKDQE